MSKEVINYNPNGTCCKSMQVIVENGVIVAAQFIGGCSGNLTGIKNLIIGMRLEEVISKFRGITCGSKSTSCPDQLALCLAQFLEEKVGAESAIQMK